MGFRDLQVFGRIRPKNGGRGGRGEGGIVNEKVHRGWKGSDNEDLSGLNEGVEFYTENPQGDLSNDAKRLIRLTI